MKVSDAFKLIKNNRNEIDHRGSIIAENPYHSDFELHRVAIKKLLRDIDMLEELVYNMELTDSYDEKTLEFLNKSSNEDI